MQLKKQEGMFWWWVPAFPHHPWWHHWWCWVETPPAGPAPHRVVSWSDGAGPLCWVGPSEVLDASSAASVPATPSVDQTWEQKCRQTLFYILWQCGWKITLYIITVVYWIIQESAGKHQFCELRVITLVRMISYNLCLSEGTANTLEDTIKD